MIRHSETDLPAPQGTHEAPAVAPQAATPPKRPGITFARTEKKTIRLALLNVMHALEQDPVWKKSVGFDELLNDVVFVKRPPYLPDTGPWQIRPITEQDYRETAIYLQETHRFWAGSPLAGEGLTTYAYRFPFHPIRAYLDGLTWDGTARLDTWLATYCHVGLTPYTRAVASKTLLAAVARVYEPGCKVDTMTILEGEQGDLKSTVWNTLAGDAWFSDSLPDLHDKDAAQALCGKWFVEFADLATFHRSEVETVKRFMSTKADHYRPSYGKKAATFPRQNVFVGSTNEAHYFKDSTGNRRFWPVRVQGICDIASLERDRNQLWAEAVARYRQGERWHLSPELEALARQEQAQRAELDDWEPAVLEYSEQNAKKSSDKTTSYITTEMLLIDCLRLENRLHHTQAHTKRLGGILRRNGWKHQQVRAVPGGNQFRAWVQPPRVPPPNPVTPVTGESEKNAPTCHSPNASNDAAIPSPVTGVTRVTCRSEHTQDTQRPSDSQKPPVTGVTRVTGVTAIENTAVTESLAPVTPVTACTPVTAPESERPTGVSPTSNASGLAVSEATFPPGRSLPGEAGEVLSREGLSERSERPLTGSPTRVPSPSPGGSGAAGAGALACSCGGLWLPTGDGRCTRCNAVRP